MPKLNIELVIDGKQANATLNLTEDQLRDIAREAAKAGQTTTSQLGNIGSIVMGLNQGLELARKGFEMVSKPLQAAGQFEQYETSLKVMLGSTEKAKARLSELVDFAKSTPFELPQVVEAANQLQAIGRYSEENLRMLGDLASASGKPMEQALSAYSKMMTGQKGIAIDMFRDLLISTDDWSRATGAKIGANGELQTSVQKMAEALPKILKEKGFDGMMQAQAETFNGMVSNMSDAFGQLETALGNKLLPIGKQVATVLGGIASALTPTKTNLESAAESADNQRFAFEKLVLKYEDLRAKSNKTNEETAEYSKIINTLQNQYPTLLGNLDLQKGKLEDVRRGFENVRKEMEANIRLELRRATAKDYIAEQEAAINQRSKVQGLLDDARTKLKMMESGQMKDELVMDPDDPDRKRFIRQSARLKSYVDAYAKQIDDADLLIKAKQFQIDETLAGIQLPKTEDEVDPNKNPKTPTTENTFSKNKEKELADIKKYNFKINEEEKASKLEYVQIQEEILNEQVKLKGIESKIKNSKSQENLDSLKEERDLSVERIKILEDEGKKKLELSDKEFDEWLKNRNDRLEAERKTVEDSKKTQTDYYEQAKFLDDNYMNYKLRNIDLEYQARLNAGISIRDAEAARKQEMKDLEQDYYDFKWQKYQEDHKLFTGVLGTMWAGYDAFFNALTSTEMSSEQKIESIWNSMKQFFIGALGDMLKEYIKQQITKAVIGKAYQATEIASAVATGSAIAAAYAPAAAMASIASFGAAALAGSAGMAATTALAYILAIPKFETGGLPRGKNAIIQVNEDGQEFVSNARATAKYLPELQAMNEGTYSRYPRNDNNAGFLMLAERFSTAIAAQTERLERVERMITMDPYKFHEEYSRFKTSQGLVGGSY